MYFSFPSKAGTHLPTPDFALEHIANKRGRLASRLHDHLYIYSLGGTCNVGPFSFRRVVIVNLGPITKRSHRPRIETIALVSFRLRSFPWRRREQEYCC